MLHRDTRDSTDRTHRPWTLRGPSRQHWTPTASSLVVIHTFRIPKKCHVVHHMENATSLGVQLPRFVKDGSRMFHNLSPLLPSPPTKSFQSGHASHSFHARGNTAVQVLPKARTLFKRLDPTTWSQPAAHLRHALVVHHRKAYASYFKDTSKSPGSPTGVHQPVLRKRPK